MALLVGNNLPVVQRLAIPAVCLLITFLAYTSQWLYARAPELSPGALTTHETYVFNALLACLWWTYYRACTVDPGRYDFPSIKKTDAATDTTAPDGRKRYCTKCAAPKPPRAHHCKACKRCIPRMDHHCPWTGNCVSLQTFPHFLRFLVFTNISLWTHLYFVWRRFHGLYELRNMPSYLGPTLSQMAFLTVHGFVGSVTSLALGILLITTTKSWLFNTTMIEGWEIERHEAVLERRDMGGEDGWWRGGERAPGGDVDAAHLAVDPVEFPYDIGIFQNMAQAMGTKNVLLWFFPFAGGPRIAKYPGSYKELENQHENQGKADMTGWYYEENDMNDTRGMWPPPDPDRLRHAKAWKQRDLQQELAEQHLYEANLTPEQRKEAFRQRQERDHQRWAAKSRPEELTRSGILDELEELPAHRGPSGGRSHTVIVNEGKSGWVNADGEHLGDYGVDEDAEFDDPGMRVSGYGHDDDADADSYRSEGEEDMYNEEENDAVLIPSAAGGGGDYEDEDVPLAELLRRRKK